MTVGGYRVFHLLKKIRCWLHFYMINVSLESFCTQKWPNTDMLPFRTGQYFKIAICVFQPEKCFIPLMSEVFKCSHFRLVHTSTLLVSSTCKYKNISCSVPSFSQKKSAWWLIFPFSSRGNQICSYLCLNESRIIQTKYFSGKIDNFSRDLQYFLFMIYHSIIYT